jgi:enterochelin esterase family protein
MTQSARSLLIAGIAMLGGLADTVRAQPQADPASPMVRSLTTASAAGRPTAVAAFWTRVAQAGAPLVEAHTHRDSSLVTFVFRGDSTVRSVRLVSGLNAVLVDGIAADFAALGEMARLAGTDVWYLTCVVGRDVRVSYRFAVTTARDSGTEIVDSLNAHVYRPDRPALTASLLELPNAPPQPWHERPREMGAWRQRQVPDRDGRMNDVFVYLPGGFDRDRAAPYPVLIGLDSYSFGTGMPGARIMDYLIETGAIPPTVMVAANVPGGTGFAQMELTAGYVVDSLLPRLRGEFNLTGDPRGVVIAGTSRRGLIAAYTAFRRPESVGNVLSLSGSFHWKPDDSAEYEWLTHRFALDPIRPIRLFVAAGNIETVVTPTNRGHYMVATNRHLRDVLVARGYDLTYWEFAGAHSDLSWQDGLARGLVVLLRAGAH